MKYLLTMVAVLVLFASCSDDSTGPDSGSNTFKTSNVKTTTTYYTFASSKADTNNAQDYDVVFTVDPVYINLGNCNLMAVYTAAIKLADGVTVAKVTAGEIDDVTTIPDASEFKSSIIEPVPVIGKKWYDMSLNYTNEVYAVKDCAGSIALIQPYAATYTGPPNHQLEDIKWHVKYAGTASDFSSIAVDSFTADNAYSEKQYYSFLSNSKVTADDAYEIALDGSSILLGKGTEAKNLGVTDINAVTTITDDNWVLDDVVSWYDYNLNGMHRLTPKSEVYVIHTADDKYIAMEVVGYDDDAGEFTIFWEYME